MRVDLIQLPPMFACGCSRHKVVHGRCSSFNSDGSPRGQRASTKRPDDDLQSLALDELIDAGAVLRVRCPDGSIGYDLVSKERQHAMAAVVELEVREWPSRLAELDAENDEIRHLLLVARWLVADLEVVDGEQVVQLADDLIKRVSDLPPPGGYFRPRDVDRAHGRTRGKYR